jgi:DNA-directed RNA polymerase III subunit RPC1
MMKLELTLDDIKWAIVAGKKLKIKQEVCTTTRTVSRSPQTSRKSITIIPRRHRLRIYVDGPDKYYRLRDLKRALPEVVVKVK